MSLRVYERKIKEMLSDSKSLMKFIEYMNESERKEDLNLYQMNPDQRGEFFYKCLANHYDEAICRVLNLLKDLDEEKTE